MSTYERALEICALIEAADPDTLATCDPRSATPPCVLVVPPIVEFAGYGSPVARWSLYAIAPNPANADSWKELERLLSIVADVVPIERAAFVSYLLSPDNPVLPAYQMTFTQGVNLA